MYLCIRKNVPDMKTPIQIAKIKAVILYIMQSFPDGVDYIKLFKILYFAQQDHLVRYGKVLVDESLEPSNTVRFRHILIRPCRLPKESPWKVILKISFPV